MANEELLDLIIKDFSLGMVTNIDESDKSLNSFREIKNARIDQEEGLLAKRLQSTYYNETSLGTLPIKSGKRFYYGTDSKELIISYDTFLKKGDDSLGTFSNIKTGLTSNKRFSFLTYKDKLYCFNGINSNLRYDGTTMKNMGCPAPASLPTLTDPTALLLHFNGLDAATTIIDVKGQTVTVGGNAQLDTAYYKFGESSLLLGASGDYLTIPAANGQFGSNDFTIDAWIRLNSLPSSGSSKIIAYQQTDVNNYQKLYIYNDAGAYKLIYKVVSGSVEIISCSYTLEELNTATWYHIFVGRKDTAFYLGFHGVVEEFSDIDDAIPDFTGALYIGGSNATQEFDGWMDEFRITKTMCRWIKDYTVPAEAYTTGTYKYAITYIYDGYQESNPYLDENEDIVECSVEAGDTVRLSNIPVSTDTDVTKRKIYRTLKDSDVYYYVDTIEDNTATIYNDTIPDSELTKEIEMDHDIPPVWKMAVLHKDRLFGLKPNSCEIDITSIIEYNSMPDVYSSVNGYIMVGEDDGDDVISIAAINGGVLCFKRSGTYLINTSAGNDITQWSVDKIDPKRGVCAPYSVANTPRGVIALSLDKENEVDLRLFNSTGSTSLGVRVKDLLDTINHLYYDEVIGEYHGGKYYLSFTDNISGLNYNHKLLVLQFNDNFSKFGYTIDDANIASFIPAFGVGDFGQMYAGMSTIGKLLRLETPSQDIIHRTSLDINSGNLMRLTESGTEEYPEFMLADESEFAGLFSNTIIDLLTNTIESYSTIDDIIYNAGYITSDILYIGATALYKIFWEVVLGADCGSAIRIRTGATEAACNTASWSEWFTDPIGSDISSVQANDYIQYQLLIASPDLPDTVSKIYRDDFIIKISAGLGSPFESYINFAIDTGKIDLGAKDKIKRLRQIVLEYEANGATLQVYLSKNDESLSLVDSINTATYPNLRQILLPFNYIGEFMRLKVTEQSLLAVKIKSIRFRYSILPKNAQILLRGRG